MVFVFLIDFADIYLFCGKNLITAIEVSSEFAGENVAGIVGF